MSYRRVTRIPSAISYLNKNKINFPKEFGRQIAIRCKLFAVNHKGGPNAIIVL